MTPIIQYNRKRIAALHILNIMKVSIRDHFLPFTKRLAKETLKDEVLYAKLDQIDALVGETVDYLDSRLESNRKEQGHANV